MMLKASNLCALFAAISLVAVCAIGGDALGQAGGQPQAAAPPAAQGARPQGGGLADQFAGRKKLLIWLDVQSGYHHDSINHAAAVVEQLGRQSGAYVSVIRSDSQVITKQPITGRGARYTGRGINARNLNDYDAIFFLGAGEGTLDSQQKLDLLSFVKDDGKGLVVSHAAGVAFFDWPEWGNLIGGFMGSEYPIQPMQILVEDQKFPGVKAFGPRFTMAEQYPVITAPYVKGKVHTIMRVDWSKLTPEQQARRPDGDIPVVFALPFGKGRVFNNGLGHNESTYDDPRIQAMLLEAIKWSMGVTPAEIPLDPPVKK
jgi:type 1 glutamine amidotransferase